MATIGFGICLLISCIVIGYMAFKSYQNINTYYWTLVILIPIILLGYWLKTRIFTGEAALVCFCFIYLDSTVLLTVMIFCMLHSLGIRVKPWIKLVAYAAAFCHMFLVWGCLENKLYYASVVVRVNRMGSITKMSSGPLKWIHYAYLGVLIAAIVTILIVSLVRKGTFSRRTLIMYVSVCATGLIMYAIEGILNVDYSTLPYLYTAADILIAVDYENTHIHDISCLISEQQAYHGSKGYAAFDLKERFLCCNQKAFDFQPALKGQIVDKRPEEGSELNALFCGLMDTYRKEGKASAKFQMGNVTCVCEAGPLSARRDGKVQGYLFEIRDATEEQKVLDVMTSYNETLNRAVADKTENIQDIQRKVVLGMANIIENRDNNTGGHVKRTSEIIHILVDEIRKQGRMQIDAQYASDIVRAAPMHDLGKVSIDSNILCKKGRLTDEEYVIMKSHSVKSSEMVMILLDGVEEEHFVKTAYNVARYHHERWDGRGYPDGLVGTMIPLEARIMAVADVYDALVSKRCYKEPMSFEKASQIMCEGMGTQFDPNMREVFMACREQLEEYYILNDR